MTDQFLPKTRLERAFIDWLIERVTDDDLLAQLRGCGVRDRQHTVVGQYTGLEAPAGSKPTAAGPTIEGPRITSPDLAEVAACHLELEEGRLHYLEFFTFGDSFPVNPEEFELSDEPLFS